MRQFLFFVAISLTLLGISCSSNFKSNSNADTLEKRKNEHRRLWALRENADAIMATDWRAIEVLEPFRKNWLSTRFSRDKIPENIRPGFAPDSRLAIVEVPSTYVFEPGSKVTDIRAILAEIKSSLQVVGLNQVVFTTYFGGLLKEVAE